LLVPTEETDMTASSTQYSSAAHNAARNAPAKLKQNAGHSKTGVISEFVFPARGQDCRRQEISAALPDRRRVLNAARIP
jgi:hypothetical protein